MELGIMCIFAEQILTIMKRQFLLLFMLLIVSNVLVSQTSAIIPLEQVAADLPKAGWVGNQAMSMFTRLEDAEYVIAPRQIDPEVGGQITSVKFFHHPYQEYNTTSYTIKIFEGVDLQWYNQGMHLYEYASCGEEVYSQDYTASGDGWQIVELTAPYLIPEGEFWVGIQMHGMGTMGLGGSNQAVEGQYFFSEMYNYNWYWSFPYFFNSSAWQDELYSLGLAIYVEEVTASDEKLDLDIRVYPNPTANQVRVEAENMERIAVIDLSGRVVRELSVNGDIVSLDLCDLDSGLYFLNIVTTQGSFLRQLSIVD